MRFWKATCKAVTRRGTRCRCKPVPGSRRCRFHGGLSTGPKTEAGKEQARRNLERGREVLNSPEHAMTRSLRNSKANRKRSATITRPGSPP